MAYQGGPKVQKVMVQPINLIFRYLQSRTLVSVWLYENVNTRMEGHIVGFDEYMNLVLDEACEVHLKNGTKKQVGRIMLKGDNITLIQSADGTSEERFFPLLIPPLTSFSLRVLAAIDAGASVAKVRQMALWLCVWGEAGNLRHMPECLCYIFHQMARELVTGSEDTREEGAYLEAVVVPLYDAIKAQKGDLHTEKSNYDDLNEFFWVSSCLDYQFCLPSYIQSLIDSGEVQEMTPIGVALHTAPKTYLERRSWLHAVRSFLRVFGFWTIGFHLIVATAFLADTQPLLGDYSNQVYAGVVITIATVSICKEFLELWASWSQLRAAFGLAIALAVRLTIKTAALVLLAGLYNSAWQSGSFSSYYTCAGVYMIPQVVLFFGQLYPIGAERLRSKSIPFFTWLRAVWWPETALYVGRNIHEPESLTWPYQLFWLLVVIWKLTCSYLFEIRPLVLPTRQLLYPDDYTATSFQALAVLKEGYLIPHINLVLLVVLWFPFVLVYLFDTLIWFAVAQAITGAIVGAFDRLGEIRNFAAVARGFVQAQAHFASKLYSIPDWPGGPRQSAERASTSEESAFPRSRFDASQWRKYAVAWNEFIGELFTGDLLTSKERDILQFRRLQVNAESKYFLPLFVTAGVIENSITYCSSLGGSIATKQTALTAHMANPLVGEAVGELLMHARWLLDALLGDAHAEELEALYEELLSYHRRCVLAKTLSLAKLANVKNSLLALVRGVRIAREFLTKQKGRSKPKAMGGRARSSGALEAGSPVAKKRLVPSSKERENMEKQLHRTPSGGSVGAGLRRIPSAGTMQHQHQQAAIAPATRGLGAMGKVHSAATLSLLDMIQTQEAAQDAELDTPEKRLTVVHCNLLKEQFRALLADIKALVTGAERPEEGFLSLHEIIDTVMAAPEGFFWDDQYASKQLGQCVDDPRCEFALEGMYHLLTLAKIECAPESHEAIRRLMFYSNSLFMDMPTPPPIRAMTSWTAMTPFYNEEIIYSDEELVKKNHDGLTLGMYLKTIYPNEWTNFLRRNQLEEPISGEANQDKVRLWATARGQTLSRTVDGMMLYEKALRLLLHLEEPSLTEAERHAIVLQKFQYVVSAQVFGQQKKELSQKARDIERLLARHPNLRVAYIDHRKVASTDAKGKGVTLDEFYSVLVKTAKNPDGTNGVEEVYRVRLPGNPLLGEGKPENQNHALIFTRGEVLQAMDMNQDNYIEESFKMRNLLEEFHRQSLPGKPTTIVGFRENIFTGSLSSIAQYMALQEGCFVTLGQRTLDRPLRTRMHYGHPDLFDKLFFISRGGISKASKGVNLSEDIFAGFNCVLRGGRVTMKEYIQVGKGRDVGLQQLFTFEAKLAGGAAMQSLSRDVYRLARNLDLCRLMTFFYGGLGFYICNSLTIMALYAFLYARLFLAAFSFMDPHAFSGVASMAYWFGQIGFLLTIPIWAGLALETGFVQATATVFRMILTGGPLFFVFHMGTKAHYFQHTLLAGGAKYRPTGRGFVTARMEFATLYRFHAFSHFYKAAELLMLLVIYRFIMPVGTHYWAITWAGWFIALSWLFAPLWFNPMAFEWKHLVEETKQFSTWMWRTEGGPDASWIAWWREETNYLMELNRSGKAWLCLLGLRHMAAGCALLYYGRNTAMELAALLSAGVVLAGAVRILRVHGIEVLSFTHCLWRAIKFWLVVGLLLLVYFFIRFSDTSLDNAVKAMQMCVALAYIFASIAFCALNVGFRWQWLLQLSQLLDWTIAHLLLLVVAVLSVLVAPGYLQTRLMFHNAFSRGVVIDNLLSQLRAPGKAAAATNDKDKRATSSPASADPNTAPSTAPGSPKGGEEDGNMSMDPAPLPAAHLA